MKPIANRAIAVLMVCAVAGWMWSASGQSAPIGSMQVKSVNMSEIDTTHVKVAVELAVVPTQSATLSDLRLCSLRLNGLPVFAAPLDQEIVLKKGVTTTLPPLFVTVMFRDLLTVEPMRRMLAEQNVHVQGELEADLRLNMAERLALHTQHPRVEFAISQNVAAEVGGSPIQRAMELAMLSVIDSGLASKARAENLVPGAVPDWVRSLDAHAAENLVVVESTYAVTRENANFPVLEDQLGFRLGSAGILTTAEAREPWKYDLEMLDAMAAGTAKMNKQSLEIALLPLGAAGQKLEARDFAVGARGNSEEESAVTDNKSRIKVLKRATADALTVLALQAPAAVPGLAAASAAVAAQESWDRVAVFRLRQDSATKLPSVEVLQLGARRDGKGIQLSNPVDSAVFGSPIVTPEGVIGLVQDEQSGTFLPMEMLAPVAAPVPAPKPVKTPVTNLMLIPQAK